MKAVILLLAVVVLGGCSLAAHSIKDYDKHVNEIVVSESNLSVACQAGFYSGLAIASDSSLKLRTAVQALDALVPDKTTPEYLKCKSKGISIAIFAIASDEKIDSLVKKITTLGLF
jgi:hypothetical protein